MVLYKTTCEAIKSDWKMNNKIPNLRLCWTLLRMILPWQRHIFRVPAGFHCHRKTVYLKGKFRDESFRSLTRNTDGKMPQLHRAGSRKVHDLNEYAFTFDRFHQRTCSSFRLLWHHTNLSTLFYPNIAWKKCGIWNITWKPLFFPVA